MIRFFEESPLHIDKTYMNSHNSQLQLYISGLVAAMSSEVRWGNELPCGCTGVTGCTLLLYPPQELVNCDLSHAILSLESIVMRWSGWQEKA